MPFTTLDGVIVTVEAAFSAATGSYGAWDAGLWNTSTWGPGEIWVDISNDVQSISTSRRFSRDLAAWQTGTATISLRNQLGWYSPSNLSGPYVTAGVTQLRPWRAVRITAQYAGISYAVYRGYALDYVESYRDASAGAGGAYVTIPCVDEYAALAAVDGLTQTPVGAGELAGRRMHRILDSAGHIGNRNIDVGQVTLQATTLENNIAMELSLTADSDAGAWWIDADGTVVFDDRLALIQKARSNTVQATYGDSPGEIYAADMRISNSGELIRNIAAFTRVGGTTQVVSDATSRALYRDKRASRVDLLCETDAQVYDLAALYVSRFAQPERRIESIQLRPRYDPHRMFPDVLGRRIRDLVRAKRRPPGGYTITSDGHITGISHTITEADWVTDLELWSGYPWTNFTTSQWDTGTWDSALWFF